MCKHGTFEHHIGTHSVPGHCFSGSGCVCVLGSEVCQGACTFKEAAIIAGICAVLLFVPKAGFILSLIAYFFLFKRMLAISAVQMIYAFLSFLVLERLLFLCSAELNSAVSRICNPQTLPTCAWSHCLRSVCRMQFGDTAECNSALHHYCKCSNAFG